MPRTDVMAPIATPSLPNLNGTKHMQSNSLRLKTAACLLSLMSGMGSAQPLPVVDARSTAITDSVVTVDALLQIENKLALAKARRDAESAGLLRSETKGSTTQAVVTPPASVLVSSIYGSDGVLRANVSYNGAAYEGVRVGAPIGKCSVVSIRSTSVQLAPSKGVNASQCPTAVWTGLSAVPSIAQLAAVGQAGGAPLPSGPLPSNLSGSPLPGQFLAPPQGQAAKFEPAVDMRQSQANAPAAAKN